jgi:hypothetical protein
MNDVSEANMDTNPWTDASNVGMCTSSIGGKLQGQDGNQQTHISNMEGKLENEDGNQKTHISDMEGKSENEDGNQQTHIFNMEGKSQKQDGIQQTHISDMEGKSNKEDGNHQTHTSNMEGKSQKEDRNQQTDTSNMDGKSKKKDWNQQAHTSNMEGKSQKKDGNQQTDTSNMEEKSKKEDGNEQTHTSRMEENGSDQNAYLECEEPFISDNQHSKDELRYCDKETAAIQKGEGHYESNFSGEETTSEVVGLTEPTTSSECEVISLPYKCFACEEEFQTRCQLFYHDLEVHVGITKPATLQSKNMSLESCQKNLKEKRTLNEVAVKRIAENIPEEQQPMKVMITEKESTIKAVKEIHEQSELKKVSLKKASAGNRLNKKFIVKQRIIQGDGKEIQMNSENLEHIKETIQAITAKYPWNETLIDTEVGSEVDEHDTKTQPKTFVIVKDDSQTGEGDQKTTGGYRIDVVTNYVLSQSQIKQLLHE